jgi:hypothetical protein
MERRDGDCFGKVSEEKEEEEEEEGRSCGCDRNVAATVDELRGLRRFPLEVAGNII